MMRPKPLIMLMFLLLAVAIFGQNLEPADSRSRLIAIADWVLPSHTESQQKLENVVRQAAHDGTGALYFQVQSPPTHWYRGGDPWGQPRFPFLSHDALAAAIKICQEQHRTIFALIRLDDLKPWDSLSVAQWQPFLFDIAQNYGLSGIVLDCRNSRISVNDLDVLGKLSFFGRGNPDQLGYPQWLKLQYARYADNLGFQLRQIHPQLITLAWSEGASPWDNPPPAALHERWLAGTVTDASGKPIGDANIALHWGNSDETKRSSLSDPNGCFAFNNVGSPRKASILISRDGYASSEIPLQFPNNGSDLVIQVVLQGNPAADQPWFKVLRPITSHEYKSSSFNLLGRTIPGNRVWLNLDYLASDAPDQAEPQELTVLSTGAFFLDHIPAPPGTSIFSLTVQDPAGNRAAYSTSITRADPETIKASDKNSPPRKFTISSPSQDLLVFSGEIIELRINGPAHWKVTASCLDGKIQAKLEEYPNPERPGASSYLARVRVPDNLTKSARRVTFTCKGPRKRTIRLRAAGSIAVQSSLQPIFAEATAAYTSVSWGLHETRLDGPYAAEVNPGTRFQVIGKVGKRYKVRLSKNLSAWVYDEEVKLLPPTTEASHGFSTFCEVSGDADYDRIWITLPQMVPWAVTPLQDSNGNWQLHVDFFNSHFAGSWFSHLETRRIVGFIRGEQVEDDWFRLTIPLNVKQLWGYQMTAAKGGMWLLIKHPPKLQSEPLHGLVIGLDAGHGGTASGAIGYMGTLEKTINSQFCDTLASALRAKGAIPVFLRPEDSNTPFDERLKTAEDAKAAMILSIHANAGDMSAGFASLSGPSVYYKYDFSRDAARYIYREMIETAGKGDGLVGNFNFNLLRKTTIPDVLIELGYLSNPTEEAQLLDPSWQETLAETIARGLEKYLHSVSE